MRTLDPIVATAAMVWLSLTVPGVSVAALPEHREKPARTLVYHQAPDVSPPESLPSALTYEPIKKCHDQISGDESLSLVVDVDGHPHNVVFEKPKGNVLDEFALKIVEADRFKPAKRDGQPVAFARKVQMHLEACGEKSKDDTGKKSLTFHLRSMPDQKFTDSREPATECRIAPIFEASSTSEDLSRVRGSVTKPEILIMREAEFSEHARRMKIEGTSIVKLVVDAHGMPQDVEISRSLEPSLDEKAIEAASGYRFKPAMKEGAPVPVRISIEIRFRFY